MLDKIGFLKDPTYSFAIALAVLISCCSITNNCTERRILDQCLQHHHPNNCAKLVGEGD
jgi:hypothetical protein